MKATVLYCDRCAAEERGNVLATFIVWLRTSLGGHTTRVDVCAEHFAVIVGQSSNGAGAPAAVAPEPTDPEWRGGAQLHRKTYERLLPYIAKHGRFSYDEALAYLGKETSAGRAGRVLAMLVEHKRVERYMAGIYQRPGYTVPE